MEPSFYTRFVFFSVVVLMLFSGAAAEHGGFEDQADPSIGSEDAEITMEVWCDFEGPFCKEFYQNSFPQIQDKYIDHGKVRAVFKARPLQNMHPWSQDAATIMECVHRQSDSLYLDTSDMIYENQDSIDNETVEENIIDYAVEQGASESQIDSCMNQEPLDEVKSDIEEAERRNISATPTIVIGDEVVEGAQDFNEFEKVIEAKLNPGEETESDENNESDSGQTDPEDLEDRLNDNSSSNVTELKEKVQEQEKEIEEIKEQQNTIVSILERIMGMLGL
jgi:protein-disulfide isomerase